MVRRKSSVRILALTQVRNLRNPRVNYIRRESINPERIFHEEPIQWAITTPLYNIGEHVANLSPEFRNEHSSIPWVKIAGLRHRLVYRYEDTNWTVICAIIYDVLPKFPDELKQL